MLRILRSKTRKVMWATLILVIPSFVFFYGWSSIEESRARAGFVSFAPPGSYRYGIPGWQRWENFDQDSLLAARRQMIGDLGFIFGQNGREIAQGLAREYGEEPLFPNREVIDKALDEWTLRRRAQERHIVVSDQEVRQMMAQQLENIPKRRWVAELRKEGYTERSFEQALRFDQMLNSVALEFQEQAKVSLFDLWKEYLLREQKLKLDYVSFKLDDYKKKIAVTESDLTKYFQANREKFRVGDQRRYRYVYFPKERLRGTVKAAEQGVGEYFEENKEKYAKGPLARVRHILAPVKLSPEMKSDEMQKIAQGAYAKVQAAKAALDKGTDFAQVANQLSEDPDNTSVDGKTKMGGLVPRWISAQDGAELGEEYVKAALALGPGKVSDVVEAKGVGKYQGFAILKCEEVREKSIPALDQVRRKVEADYVNSLLDKEFEKKRQTVDEKLKDYTDLGKMAQEQKMTLGETTWTLVSASVIAPELGVISQEDLEYVRELRPGDRSVLLNSGAVLYVLQIINQRPSFIPRFEDIRRKVEEAYRIAKGRDLMRTAARDLLKRSRNLDEMRANAASESLEMKTTDFFVRADPPKTMPSPFSNFPRDSAKAKRGTVGMTDVGFGAQDVSAAVVWLVKEIKDPDRKKFLGEVATLQHDLLALKQRALLDEWLSDQRNAMKVKINPDLIGGEEG